MRQITTLPEEKAQTFADYLLTLKIQTQLRPEAEGVGVWICDEDQVARAREELGGFTRNPSDERYQSARPAASALRRQEARVEEAYNRRQERLTQAMRGVAVGRRPLTLALVVVSIGVALGSNFGNREGPLLQALHISTFRIEEEGGVLKIFWPYLSEIRSGQVWRLVTPIFIHFGVVHLAFNVLAMLSLGGQMEARRGTVRFLLFVLVVAVLSNLAQYYLGHSRFENGRFVPSGAPNFGGMSGVLYGVFGYLWAKSRLEPRLGLTMSRESVLVMMGWFVLCWLGVLGSIANVAHTAGLLLGLAIAAAPSWWRWLRHGDAQLDV
jgi:GlpG protein